ncbi:GTP pyrophosphokinase [Gallibacterium anatis]|uniref:GTP pyrophosphokinase n=1 Tax=Gallibacterium anatis TaxID=750 RepID=UPI000532132B|nr:GTP pyrophosphokinase [Gallibacterium anatis]KGQ46840.1 GTP pyrophosphokinase [Gallibacterium anatis]KGQ57220.1 GTP pyrophosphokinase [Gallibacterium anatis str. Avicor]KGQ64016.1 GTP pyrophosphokinase [Gallibacterium anatis 7990]
MLEKVERLIDEINKVHSAFSEDYFKTGKIKTVDILSKTTVQHILDYRLNLHESISDYLYRADLYDISYFYRVKTSESILEKIKRFQQRNEGYPVNSILNDIFGARIIVSSEDISQIMEQLDNWKEKYGLKNWYLRDKEEYIGIHIYFKNSSNFYYPWELQIWDKKDAEKNIQSHIKYKRGFVGSLR